MTGNPSTLTISGNGHLDHLSVSPLTSRFTYNVFDNQNGLSAAMDANDERVFMNTMRQANSQK